VHDGSEQFADHLANAVAKKLMWEYFRKCGHLIWFFDGRVKLTLDEVLQFVPAKMISEYEQFCKRHTL